MKEFELGHAGDIGISKSKIFEIVEKALDKACEELEDLDRCHAYEINKQIVEKKGYNTITFGYQNKDEWKEWCMKDVD